MTFSDLFVQQRKTTKKKKTPTETGGDQLDSRPGFILRVTTFRAQELPSPSEKVSQPCCSINSRGPLGTSLDSSAGLFFRGSKTQLTGLVDANQHRAPYDQLEKDESGHKEHLTL